MAIRERDARLNTVLLVLAKADTTAGVPATLASLTGALASRDRDLVITVDRPAIDRALATAGRAKDSGTVSVRDTKVSGLLAKEPVTLAFFENRSSFHRCHAKAKAGGEPPPERVSLRFVLDVRGKAQKTSLEPAGGRLFGACMEAAVDVIPWPSAEGGIATVTTRLDVD